MPFASRSVIFDEFRFILPTRELLRIGNDDLSTPIPLGSRAAEILYLLLQRHGDIVSKNEIMDAAWPHMAMQESNLAVQISALRRAIDDGRNDGSCIQTVPGRGYRFTPRVVEEDGQEPGLSLVHRYRMGLIPRPMLTVHRRNPCLQPYCRWIPAEEAPEMGSLGALSDFSARP
jgi:DNA-binding winged helix-turn-helix (wHTH) protein